MIASGANRRIRSGRLGPMGTGTAAAPPPPDPPVDFEWRPISVTSALEQQWMGFSDGGPTRPQPAFGSISRQPSPLIDLVALYDDTNSDVYLAVFLGEWLPEMGSLPMSIGGTVFTPFSTEIIDGNTWLRYNGVGDWEDGAVYEVEFG